jgi:hypothetical protein
VHSLGRRQPCVKHDLNVGKQLSRDGADFRMTRRRLSEAMANSAFEKLSLNSQVETKVSATDLHLKIPRYNRAFQKPSIHIPSISSYYLSSTFQPHRRCRSSGNVHSTGDRA